MGGRAHQGWEPCSQPFQFFKNPDHRQRSRSVCTLEFICDSQRKFQVCDQDSKLYNGWSKAKLGLGGGWGGAHPGARALRVVRPSKVRSVPVVRQPWGSILAPSVFPKILITDKDPGACALLNSFATHSAIFKSVIRISDH